MRKVPVWKVEGYFDYTATTVLLHEIVPHTLEERIAQLADNPRPARRESQERRFKRWRLQVEYLCVVRGLRFEDLIDPAITEAGVQTEMMRWSQQRLNGNARLSRTG